MEANTAANTTANIAANTVANTAANAAANTAANTDCKIDGINCEDIESALFNDGEEIPENIKRNPFFALFKNKLVTGSRGFRLSEFIRLSWTCMRYYSGYKDITPEIVIVCLATTKQYLTRTSSFKTVAFTNICNFMSKVKFENSTEKQKYNIGRIFDIAVHLYKKNIGADLLTQLCERHAGPIATIIALLNSESSNRIARTIL